MKRASQREVLQLYVEKKTSAHSFQCESLIWWGCGEGKEQVGLNCGRVEYMKEIGNSQPSTAEPSKKKRRQTSTHYTDRKRKSLRIQKIQTPKAPIKGCGTPDELRKNIKSRRRPELRLDCEILPFALSSILEQTDGSNAHTMTDDEEVGSDDIYEDSRQKTKSTSVVSNFYISHKFSYLSRAVK